MQAQFSEGKQSSMLRSFINIYRTEGIQGLWRVSAKRILTHHELKVKSTLSMVWIGSCLAVQAIWSLSPILSAVISKTGYLTPPKRDMIEIKLKRHHIVSQPTFLVTLYPFYLRLVGHYTDFQRVHNKQCCHPVMKKLILPETLEIEILFHSCWTISY